MKRFKSARQLQRFVAIHDPVVNLVHFPATAFHRLTIATYELLSWKHGGTSPISTLPENSKIREYPTKLV
jgi:putative transposase